MESSMGAILAVLLTTSSATAQDDETIKRIANRIDKILEEHGKRVAEETQRIVKEEVVKAGPAPVARTLVRRWELYLEEVAGKLKDEGVSGDFKKALREKARLKAMAAALAQQTRADPQRAGATLFDVDEKNLLSVRKDQEERVRKLLAAGVAPRPAGRPRLGFSADTEFTDEERKAAGLEPGVGVRVVSVSPDGPADKAGLRPEDIVVKIDGKEFPADKDAAGKLISELSPGQDVDVEILRDGKSETLRLKVGSQE
jgi:hypothetical protein